MRKVYSNVQEAGAEVLVVAMSRPDVLAWYLAQNPFPFPVVADPSLAAYRQFELERATMMSFFRPGVLWRFLRLMARGWRSRRPNAGEDPLQLGGDFILDRQQRLTYVHPSRNATDRPAAAELVRQLELGAN